VGYTPVINLGPELSITYYLGGIPKHKVSSILQASASCWDLFTPLIIKHFLRTPAFLRYPARTSSVLGGYHIPPLFNLALRNTPQPPYSTKFRMKFNCFETVPVATCATAETCYTVYGHPARNGNPHNVASPTINTPKSSPLWLYDGLW